MFSINLETQEIRKTDLNLIWLQKIGLTSDAVHALKSIEDLREDFEHLVDELNMTASAFTQADNALVGQLTRKCSNLLKNRKGAVSVQTIALYAMIYFSKKQEGLQSICSNYVKLFSSFVNTDSRIFVSHNRYLSSYNLRNEKWSKEHIDFGEQIQKLVQIGRFGGEPEAIRIGVFVGYNSIRFL